MIQYVLLKKTALIASEIAYRWYQEIDTLIGILQPYKAAEISLLGVFKCEIKWCNIPWHSARWGNSAATSERLSVTLLQLRRHQAAVKQSLKMLSFQQWEPENVKGNN